MHKLYLLLFGSVGAMSLLAAAFVPGPEADAPQADLPAAQGKAREPDSWHETRALTLKRDSTGQFHVNAGVNGERVRFLVDTGADMVALTVEEADTLGLTYGEMQPIMQTAAGVGYGAPVEIEEIEVGGTVVRNVNAIVAQDLPVNLLGQSVLRQLGGVELSGDTMVIRPR
jgi:aspartyl protease family protein